VLSRITHYIPSLKDIQFVYVHIRIYLFIYLFIFFSIFSFPS